VVTICTNRFNIQQFYVLPTQCIYVFCVDLRTNSNYFPTQHWLTGLYNRDGECLQRGKSWIFIIHVILVWCTEQLLPYVCIYVHRPMCDGTALHTGLLGFWTLPIIQCSKNNVFRGLNMFHSQVKWLLEPYLEMFNIRTAMRRNWDISVSIVTS